MRKSLLLIAAALVVLCFTQCTKQRPSNPYMGKKTGNISFTASPSGGDSKNHFTDPMTGGLNFTWEADDELYVYCSPSGNFENDGYYSGKIGIVSGVGEVGAKFSGEVNYYNDKGAKLRFYYFGNDVSIDGDVDKPNSNVSATADFSIQDRKSAKETDTDNNETVSDKLIAMLECPVNKNILSAGDYGGTLEVQFAIVKAIFKGFNESSNISVQGISKKGVYVNERGVLSYTDGTTISLTDLTYLNGNGNFSEPYYIVFMDEDDGLEADAKNAHQFYDSDSKNSTVSGELHKGIFYTKKQNVGQPVEIVAGTDLILINSSTGGNQGDGQ